LRYLERRRGGGLVVCENLTDTHAVGRALAEMDDRLFLVEDHDPLHQRVVYKVLRRVSDWQDAVHILDWRDEQTLEPLPLSSGIIDAVQRLRPENRHKRVDEDQHNAQLVASRKREFEADIDYLRDHYEPLVGSGPDPHHVQGQISKPKRFGAK
jgi:hypothetical protein